MMEILAFNDSVKSDSVLIYGGTIWGKTVCQYLIERGIEVKAIFDKYQCGEEFKEIVIQNPEKICDYKGLPVIVCATRGFKSMCDFLEQKGFDKAYHAGDIFNDVDWSQIHTWDSYDKDEMVGKYMKFVHSYQGIEVDKIEMDQFNVIMNIVCNLKCDKCLSRCPDIKNKLQYSAECIINNLGKILQQVSCIYKIILCGGEPMLHPELDKVLEYCVKQDKIKRIEVLTNSTFIPKENILNSFSHHKIRIIFDDYNLKEQKIGQWVEVCKERNISYDIKKLEYWYDLSMEDNLNYSDEELIQLYRECTESENYTLVDGKFVNCYRTFVDSLCGDYKSICEDYFVDLSKYGNSDSTLKDAMLKLIHNKYLDRCRYCTGTGKKVRLVPVAEQRQ